jgi:16S rRNA processing protein RimM
MQRRRAPLEVFRGDAITVRKRDSRVCVGRITGARGLTGELRVRSFTADPEAVAAYGPVVTDSGERVLHLRVVGTTKNAIVVRAAGIDDRAAAEALRGTGLYVDRAKLPPTADDEFYHADLIGLVAVHAGSESGRPLGEVAAVHDFGAGPLLEIEAPGAPPVLVPFTRQAVLEVDVAGGRIVVAALPGLFGADRGPESAAGEA